jgi:hypothetical protein
VLNAVTGKNYLYDSTATRVIVSDSFEGPIEGVAGGVISLFGAQIQCLPETIVERNSVTSECATLAIGDHIEVHATYESERSWKASRIEVTDPDGSYKTQGTINNLVPNLSLELNGILFDISTLSTTSISNGDEIHAIFSSTKNNQNNWIVTQIISSSTTGKITSLWQDFEFEDRDAELEGIVRNLSLSSNSFEVNGIVVDASGVSLVGLSNGSYIEVEGRFVNSKLVAQSIERDDFEIKRSKFELYGSLSGLTTNELAARSGDFTVRGMTVLFNNNTILPNAIADGQYVEVEGTLSNGVLTASKVEVEDSNEGLDDGGNEVDVDDDDIDDDDDDDDDD